MSEADRRFHEEWMGIVQPVDGLVFSVPVLEDAACAVRHPPELQHRVKALCPEKADGSREIADLPAFLDGLLGLRLDLFDRGDALPEDLSLWVPEGRQKLVPTMALRRRDEPAEAKAVTDEESLPDETTPESRAGSGYLMLVWQLPNGLSFDRAEVQTGEWHYPPAAKFDRLLRACRVPMGLLTNGVAVRLVFAPHGEASGAVTFPIMTLAASAGRPVLDAFTELLSAQRTFRKPAEQSLLGLLVESRQRQANVTNELAKQVLEALQILLDGFAAAAERDGRTLDPEGDELYGGLLTALLRLVFMLYAEDYRDGRGHALLPMEQPLFDEHLSVHALYDQLQADADRYPDTMDRRFGAWSRLVAAFRAVHQGTAHAGLTMPGRRGELFDPGRYAFLEGWVGAPPMNAAERAQTRVPRVSDETVYRVLKRLLVLGASERSRGQRLAYRSLQVEQIGSVYEGLMGFGVVRVRGAAVCVKPNKIWVVAQDVLDEAPGRRESYLIDRADVEKTSARKVSEPLKKARNVSDVIAALEPLRIRGTGTAAEGGLVLEPDGDRRRTLTNYTPRSLTEPVVRRTLEPLLVAMKQKSGAEPTSAEILSLKVCDPAMGSGAFLVAACRFLADQVVAAWTREGRLDKVASTEEDAGVLARRLVAQRCIYGVDRNRFATNLAKLSLWLATLSKDEPFTFVDHSLRTGDTLVGLSLDQIKRFHWDSSPQQSIVGLLMREIDDGLREAQGYRERILALAGEVGREVTEQKEKLLKEADDAVDRAKLIGDLVVGAFFSAGKDKERLAERARCEKRVSDWLAGAQARPADLVDQQAVLRSGIRPFHWMLEFPEIFHDARLDPLAEKAPEWTAHMDAFVGNPPFAGKNLIADVYGPAYVEWLKTLHPDSHGNADLSAHFVRRADALLGTHGTFGLLTTNTIAQGDTRASGLQRLVNDGSVIYEAVSSRKWPGTANVAYSVLHLAKGRAAQAVGGKRLDGEVASWINSRLRPKPERPDPKPLLANEGLNYVGSYILGMGFTFEDDNPAATPLAEMERLVRKSRHNQERIFPYIGGEELNTSPTQSHHRYVINFGDMSLKDASRWPDLLAIVRNKVKHERDANNRMAYRERWWQFGEKRPALYAALGGRSRCLGISRHSKHLVLSWQPANRVFAESMYVFLVQQDAEFAVLQSRIHEVWARLLSSSLEDRLRYTASDCFNTFPFPIAGTLASTALLERIGSQLDGARVRLMRSRDYGLTVLYNCLKDSTNTDREVVALRCLHQDMDRAVLRAYGWDDVVVPPFFDARTDAEKKEREAFADEVLDRLFALNAM